MRKIPKKYSGLLIGAILALIMGFIMSFATTIINLGLTEDFLNNWMIAFIGTLPVGLPVSLVVTPPVKALVDRISE